MKFKLVEKFDSLEARNAHFRKHADEFSPPFETPEDYDNAAMRLAMKYHGAKLASDRIAPLVGYISLDDRYIVYNRLTEEIVIFVVDDNDDITIISFYPTSDASYRDTMHGLGIPEHAYAKELPQNQEIVDKLRQERKQAKADYEARKAEYEAKLEKEKAKELGRKKYLKRMARGKK